MTERIANEDEQLRRNWGRVWNGVPERSMCFYRCEDGAGGRCYAWAEGVREAIEMARRCLPNVTAATLLFTSDDPPFVLEEET